MTFFPLFFFPEPSVGHIAFYMQIAIIMLWNRLWIPSSLNENMKRQMLCWAEGYESGTYIHLKWDIGTNSSLHRGVNSWQVTEGSLQTQSLSWAAQKCCLGTADQPTVLFFNRESWVGAKWGRRRGMPGKLQSAGWPQAPGWLGAPGPEGNSQAITAPGSPLPSWLLCYFIYYKYTVFLTTVLLTPGLGVVCECGWRSLRVGGWGLSLCGREVWSHEATHHSLAWFICYFYLFVYMESLLPALIDRITTWARMSGTLPLPSWSSPLLPPRHGGHLGWEMGKVHALFHTVLF